MIRRLTLLVVSVLFVVGQAAAQDRPAGGAEAADRERAAFAACVASDTRGPCDAYLSRYPDGAFRDRASVRMAEIALSMAPPPPPPPAPPAPSLPPSQWALLPGLLQSSPFTLPSSDEPVATRLFARSFGDIPGDFGAIAVILLPNDAALNPTRLTQVCTAFVAVLGDATATAAVAPHRAQMVTVWPVTANFPATRSDVAAGHGAAAVTALCPLATELYDFTIAEKVRRLVPKAAQPAAGGRGPFLVAWAPGRRLGDPRSPMLTFDLSGVEGQKRLTRAFKLWKQQIEERPQLWRHGWDATLFQLQISSTVDAVGAQIGSAMKLVPWLGGGN